MLVHLDRAAPAHGDVLMSAAMQLFTAADAVDLAIRIRGVPDPVEADAEQLAARCAAVCPHPETLPEIVLLAEAEEPDHPVVLTVEQTPDVAQTARSVIMLAALAQQLWDGESVPTSQPAQPSVPTQPAQPTQPARASNHSEPRPTITDEQPQRPGPSLILRDPALGGTDEGYGETSLAAKLSRLASVPRQDDGTTASDGRPPSA
ncbi:MAG: hypothetical protein U0Q19_08415 [Kineosporiaceae bacterium]